MPRQNALIRAIESSFPDDRLTYQKTIPTFHPESASEAARLFQLANEHRQTLFITGFGNHIDPIGKPFDNAISVRTDRLNRLLTVAPEDFYVTVGAGYPLREINLDIADRGLWMAHSALPYVGSAGGAVAVGLGATLHGHEVPIRRYLIQAEIVTPTGEIIKPGSPSFKSVSGYDIVKIFSGSWGLLGLLVSLTFRVLPVGGAADFATMTQNGVSRSLLERAFDANNMAVDAVYVRKIKAQFDPRGVLPMIPEGQLAKEAAL